MRVRARLFSAAVENTRRHVAVQELRSDVETLEGLGVLEKVRGRRA